MLLLTAPAWAVQPGEMLDDPALEARAREISRELRCLVCQNQSIDDSDATLARDLRLLVRERLVAGDDDREVVNYVVSRYGDFVLLKPPFKPATYALWFAPPLAAGLGVFAVVTFYRRRRGAAAVSEPKPLTEDERKRLERLVGDGQP
jgi:cytochrome c-type biogenesis protein CcmH